MRDVELDRRVLGLQSTGEQLCSRQHRRPVHGRTLDLPRKDWDIRYLRYFGNSDIASFFSKWGTRLSRFLGLQQNLWVVSDSGS